jgi:deoxyadenosine/deoxycytidine kinase|tara:strand:- start:443 stop:1096 length:654 start_codon:yes stop_codon:yes gene_type:complete
MDPKIISIEGNIGSGKSTMVEYLKQNLKNDPTVCFLQEPVDIWNTITDENGVNIIENYYKDQKKYAFQFQMMAYISRISLLREALKKNYKLIITERSIFTDANVFAKMLYDEGKIGETEYKIYKLWFDEFIKDIPKISLIYVKTDPEICNRRVLIRNRVGENIPLDYLKECNNYHEKWINDNKDCLNVLTLDGNPTMSEQLKKDNIEKINQFSMLCY